MAVISVPSPTGFGREPPLECYAPCLSFHPHTKSKLGSSFVWPGHSHVHMLARHRPVKGVTLTGLPDSVRCDILSHLALNFRNIYNAHPGGPLIRARERRLTRASARVERRRPWRRRPEGVRRMRQTGAQGDGCLSSGLKRRPPDGASEKRRCFGPRYGTGRNKASEALIALRNCRRLDQHRRFHEQAQCTDQQSEHSSFLVTMHSQNQRVSL